MACAGGLNQAVATFALGLPDGANLASYQGPPPAEGEAGTPEQGGNEGPSNARRRSKGQYQTAILARNIFDSEAIGKDIEASGGDGGNATTLKVELRATLVARPAEFSTAYLVDANSGQGGAYGIGQKILGAEIIGIESQLVRLRTADGNEEVVKISAGKEDKKGNNRPDKQPAGDDGEITKNSDTEFEVSRELVDRYLNDLEGISRLGRAIPHRGPDGNIDGYRLSGIRRGTVGEKLGIRNGDIVHKVNGYDLNSMSEAMKAFQELQNDSNFSFEITRRGKQQTMRYSVR